MENTSAQWDLNEDGVTIAQLLFKHLRDFLQMIQTSHLTLC